MLSAFYTCYLYIVTSAKHLPFMSNLFVDLSKCSEEIFVKFLV